MLDVKICKLCKQKFQPHRKTNQFCSHSCSVKFRYKDQWDKCPQCGAKKLKRKQYCNKQCYDVAKTIQRIEFKCIICSNTFYKRVNGKDDHIKTCGHGCSIILRNYNRLISRLQKQCLKEYEVLFNVDSYSGTSYSTFYNFKHHECGTIFEDNIMNGKPPRCPVCFPVTALTSNQETEIKNYLVDELQITDIKQSDRKILNGLELDLYSKKHKIAIEYNGLYWHSENQGKDKNYHINKTIECEKLGLQLIHIFSDEWEFKRDIVKSRLRNLLGKNENRIYARKCIIKEIDATLKNQFLDENHIQGADKAGIKLGLFFEDNLVSVMTFSKPRIALGNKNNNDGTFELSRYCNIQNTNIIGGASKLLKYFIKKHSPVEIISYADRRWSKGKLYETLNFKLVNNGQPNYWYTNNQIRMHRFGFRKNTLKEKLQIFNNTLTEIENMKMNGFDRIWDCGSKKYKISFGS